MVKTARYLVNLLCFMVNRRIRRNRRRRQMPSSVLFSRRPDIEQFPLYLQQREHRRPVYRSCQRDLGGVGFATRRANARRCAEPIVLGFQRNKNDPATAANLFTTPDNVTVRRLHSLLRTQYAPAPLPYYHNEALSAPQLSEVQPIAMLRSWKHYAQAEYLNAPGAPPTQTYGWVEIAVKSVYL